MIQAVLHGVAAFALLELLYVLLRRAPWPIAVRWLYHLWALDVGVVATLAVVAPERSLGWRVAASAAAILTALVLFSLLDSLVFKRPWNTRLGPMMPKLARDVLRVVALAAAVLVVATVILEQPLPAVLVSSTVLSAVIGLALQDVLKNVFAGMALELEKPFERGDWLLLDGTGGAHGVTGTSGTGGINPVQVLDTSWRSVRLRNNEGVDFWEPNSSLSLSRLVNYGSGARPVGLSFRVTLRYEEPPARVRAALLAAARAAPLVAASPEPQAFVESFTDRGVMYRLRVWTHAVAQLTLFTDAVYSRVWYELNRQGLELPFPVRVVQWHHAERDERRRDTARRQSAVELLRGVTLFQGLGEPELEHLAGSALWLHFDDGEVLVNEGEMGDSLFVIDQGRVQISVAGKDLGTGEIQLASVEAGGFFGEISLLTGEPRSATVTSDGGCEVLVLSKEHLAPLLQGDPRLAELIAAAVVARQARSAAKLEDRRKRLEEPAAMRAQASLLGRIRSFFKLPG
jgi:small-conductance mechanosensitive channel/CRP-like cAMP-binding protein